MNLTSATEVSLKSEMYPEDGVVSVAIKFDIVGVFSLEGSVADII